MQTESEFTRHGLVFLFLVRPFCYDLWDTLFFCNDFWIKTQFAKIQKRDQET
jgi:hypothetical protein